MHGVGRANGLLYFTMPDNKSDAVPCNRLQRFYCGRLSAASIFQTIIDF
jgi:hypothetical protein